MKKTKSVLLIIFIMLFILFIGNAFAVSDTVARLSVNVTPNNPAVGEEVKINIGFSEISEGVKSVKFSLNYDDNVLEYKGATAGEGWTSSLEENNFTISTTNNEVTTQTGTILTITLEVKEGVGANTQSILSLTSISVETDTETVDDFNDLSTTLTIRKTEGGSQAGGNEVEDNPTANEINGNEITGNEVTGNEVIGNGVTEGNGEPVVNTLPVQKINEIGNYTTEDKEVPSIPQTGEDYGVQISIIGLAILSIISYVVYRKNKI